MPLIEEQPLHFTDKEHMMHALGEQGVHALDVMPMSELQLTQDRSIHIGNAAYDISHTGLQDLCSRASLGYSGIRKHIYREKFEWIDAANSYLKDENDLVQPVIRDGAIVAVRSERFSLVPNAEVAQKTLEQIPPGYEFLAARWNPTSFRMIFTNNDQKITLGETDHFSAYSQLNSETGHKTLAYIWSLFTAACTNLTLFGGHNMGSVRGRHVGDLGDRASDMMNQFMNGANKQLDLVSETLPVMYDKNFNADGKFIKNYTGQLEGVLGKKSAKEYIERRNSNRYYNEFYRVTQKAQDIKCANTREDMENLGGWIMHYVANNKHDLN